MFNNNPISSMQIPSSNQNKPSFIDLLQNFLDNNTKFGYLIFQVYQDSVLEGLLPVANAKITVSKLIGDGHYVSKVITTDSDGKTKPIRLPTVNADYSKVPGSYKVCSKYNTHVEAQDFIPTDIFDISVFDGITSLQTINLIPKIDKNYNRIYQDKSQRFCQPW